VLEESGDESGGESDEGAESDEDEVVQARERDKGDKGGVKGGLRGGVVGGEDDMPVEFMQRGKWKHGQTVRVLWRKKTWVGTLGGVTRVNKRITGANIDYGEPWNEAWEDASAITFIP
jgi:hypothetical protein